jgi:hypothetical protein
MFNSHRKVIAVHIAFAVHCTSTAVETASPVQLVVDVPAEAGVLVLQAHVAVPIGCPKAPDRPAEICASGNCVLWGRMKRCQGDRWPIHRAASG